MLKVRIHGARGSTPTPAVECQRYGGDTSCYEIDLGTPDRRIFLDSGTGLRNVDAGSLPDSGAEIDILFSHFHWDHIEGLPFFPPLFLPQHRFTFYGRPEGVSLRFAVEGALRPPWFPVALADTPSAKSYSDLSGDPFSLGDALVTPLALNHPQGVMGYRFDFEGRSVAIATDHESGVEAIDRSLVEWACGVDVLLHDAQYTAEDYEAHRGWGHSTWEQAIETAIAADVGQLVMISHEPSRTDREIDSLLEAARVRFPRTTAGSVGSTIEI